MTAVVTRRSLISYAWPIALSSIGSVTIGLVDSLVMGRYATESLAGVALGATIYELPAHALLGGLMAYSILAPRAAGPEGRIRDTVGLRRVLIPMLVVSALAALVLAVLGIVLHRTAEEPSTQAAGEYLIGRSPSLILETLSAALVTTLLAWGFRKSPLVVFAFSSLTNVVLDIVLVYGLGPAPELGALGNGLASTCGVLCALPWLVLKMLRAGRVGERSNATASHFDGWFAISRPAIASAAVDYGGNLVFTFLLSVAGTAVLAGARIGAQAHLFVFVMIASLSSAGLVLIGRAFDYDENVALRELPALRRTFLLVSGGIGGLFLGLAIAIPRIVSADPSVHVSGFFAIGIVAILCPIAGYTYANITVLRALGRTSDDFKSNALAVWAAQIPVALLGLLTIGGMGAFAGLIAYWGYRAYATRVQIARLQPLGEALSGEH